MLLGKWMRTERLSNRKLAEMIGGISADGVNKIRYRQRGPSIQVAARIAELTAGKVLPVDMLPTVKAKKSPGQPAKRAERP